MLKAPPSLKIGDTVAIVSTARKISKVEIEFAIKTFENWGLKVVLGKTIGAEYHQFAGEDEYRASDFQEMMDNPKIKAIICARGGYGTVRILDYLDFTHFTNNPKWIVGYSDVTALHTLINCYLNIQTIHGTMPINFSNNTTESLNSLKKALFGEKYFIEADPHSFNKIGTIEGEIIGGNLSILYSILGTKSGFNTDDKILFIEDLDEYLYHIDRMIVALKRAGKFKKLKGLIVGGMTDMNDNTIPFGKTSEAIIDEHFKDFDFPICYKFPAGHIKDNRSLVFGKKSKLTISKKDVNLIFEN